MTLALRSDGLRDIAKDVERDIAIALLLVRTMGAEAPRYLAAINAA